MEDFVEREVQRLRASFLNTVAAKDVAAVIVEVVQGEGGFIPVPATWLETLRTICDEHGIVLIFDEIQSGFCRTGRWAAYEHYGVTPDISTWAKSMGGGLPISAVIGRAHIMDASAPGTLGGTYGGNPLACVASLAAINAMESLNLNARAMEIGAIVRGRFESLMQRCPMIGDIRGLGAMIAIECVENCNPSQPATEFVREVLAGALARGVLAISSGIHSNAIRILSPLVITNDALERGLTVLEEEILLAWAKYEPVHAALV